jgi:uncharacterized protein YbcI
MPSPGTPDEETVLAAITDALAVMHQRHYGRLPHSARTMFMGDDMLACVMGGVYTDVEKTLIELQREPLVAEARSTFQEAMSHRLIAAVQRISGRTVQKFLSTHHVGPDIEVELFLLVPAP